MKDCGGACLATISKQYALKIPISKIREVAGTDKQGTSAYGIIKAVEQLDFTAKGVKLNKPEDIFSEFQLLPIAHVVIDGKVLHCFIMLFIPYIIILYAIYANTLLAKYISTSLEYLMGTSVVVITIVTI